MYLCEIKYTSSPFVLTRQYAEELEKKKDLFIKHTKTKKQVLIVLITANGLKPNAWSNEVVDRVVTSKELLVHVR
jgi:uncharacterized protein